MLGVFYYPWYGGKANAEVVYRHWKDAGHSPPTTWNSRYLPDITVSTATEDRLYDSQDIDIVNDQMQRISDCHIDFVLWSWFGQDTFSDHSIANFWENGTNPAGLKHCIYYEKEWDPGNIPLDEVMDDMQYIKNNYAGNNSDPNSKYLRLQKNAVIGVFNATPDEFVGVTDYQKNLAKKWNIARKRKAIHTILKVSTGWQNWKTYSSSWHQYGPSTHYAKITGYSSYVSPGWWRPDQSTPRLVRSTSRFDADVKAMSTDGTPLKFIQTWNEWTEGTSIEPSTDWGSDYTDIIARYF